MKKGSEQLIEGYCTFIHEPSRRGIAFQDARFVLFEGRQKLPEGVHMLRTGDELSVFDPADPKKVLYSGVLDFDRPIQGKIHPLTFAQWFVEEYPGLLRKTIVQE